MKSYSKLLQHPKWQKKRLEIFERDNFICRLCDDTETTLHVHHKKYKFDSLPWEYENEDLITLCEKCHGDVEGFKKAGNPLDIESIKIFNLGEDMIFIKSPEGLHILAWNDPGLLLKGNTQKALMEFLKNIPDG